MTEAGKKELSFGLNSFNQPQEYSGVNAWARQIMQLLIMRKGTYPSDPNMGGDMDKHNFETLTKFQITILNDFKSQIATYLPDIPVADITLQDYMDDTRKYVIFVITFNVNNVTEVAVVASRKSSSNIIDFKVSI